MGQHRSRQTRTDRQLAVIKPGANASADDLRGLGQALACWQSEFSQARHIWGLTDLLEGRFPRTPCDYVNGEAILNVLDGSVALMTCTF